MIRLALILLCAMASPAARADEASLREARLLIDAMHMERQLDAMSAALSQGMARELASMGGGGRNPRVPEIFMSESMAVMKERARQPGGLIDRAITAYAETFSAEELREIRAFYESPTGRKMTDRAPELMSRVMQGGLGAARGTYPEICARAKARLEAEGLKAEADAMRCALPPAPKGNG